MIAGGEQFAVSEIDVGEVVGRKADLFLVAPGYEERASFLPEYLAEMQADRRVALAFEDRPSEPYRKQNDRALRDLGFCLVAANGSRGDVAEAQLAKTVAQSGEEERRIVVDYSCMTRVWYAAIVRFLAHHCAGPIEADFVYAPSEYSAPRAARPNRYVEALTGFSGLSAPDRPTALVLGLGYESERAIGLVNYLEPALTAVFLADPALEPDFVEAAERANRPLLDVLPEEQVARYPLGDLQSTAALLESCCLGLVRDHRVVIAPLGPKPFTLLSLLLASGDPRMEVWRVSAGEKGNVKSRKALGRVLGLQVRRARCSL